MVYRIKFQGVKWLVLCADEEWLDNDPGLCEILRGCQEEQTSTKSSTYRQSRSCRRDEAVLSSARVRIIFICYQEHALGGGFRCSKQTLLFWATGMVRHSYPSRMTQLQLVNTSPAAILLLSIGENVSLKTSGFSLASEDVFVH